MKTQLIIWSVKNPRGIQRGKLCQRAGPAEEGFGGESKEQVRARGDHSKWGREMGVQSHPQHT